MMGGTEPTHGGLTPFRNTGDSNGGHRQTNTTIYGNTAGQPGLSAGGGTAAQIRALQAQYHARQATGGAGLSAQNIAVLQQRLANQLQAQVLVNAWAATEPVENEGVKVGEVIAWRCWRVFEGWLYSFTMENVEWLPGDVQEAHKVGQNHGEGIHAFKTRRQAIEYTTNSDAVVGKVALWGDVVEFEHGYHAEFARIVSIDWGRSYVDLETMRNTYGFGSMVIPQMERK